MKAEQLKIEKNILYIDNVPAFVIMENGQKDPVTPTGWNTYRGNQQMIDDWLEYQVRSKRKRVI
jgi:hypothetical protein